MSKTSERREKAKKLLEDYVKFSDGLITQRRIGVAKTYSLGKIKWFNFKEFFYWALFLFSDIFGVCPFGFYGV